MAGPCRASCALQGPITHGGHLISERGHVGPLRGEDTLAGKSGRPRKKRANELALDEFEAALRANPGEWAIHSQTRTSPNVRRFKRRGLEVTSRNMGDHYILYVRAAPGGPSTLDDWSCDMEWQTPPPVVPSALKHEELPALKPDPFGWTAEELAEAVRIGLEWLFPVPEGGAGISLQRIRGET